MTHSPPMYHSPWIVCVNISPGAFLYALREEAGEFPRRFSGTLISNLKKEVMRQEDDADFLYALFFVSGCVPSSFQPYSLSPSMFFSCLWG